MARLPAPLRERWQAVLDQVASLCGDPQAVEELPGGLTNVNLKVTCDDRVVVVRVAQPGSELLGIDRVNEHRNSVAAAEAGVGAPVVAYVPEAGLLVVEFIEGLTLSDDDLRAGDRLPRVANACRQLHRGPRFVNRFDMFDLQRQYLEAVQRGGFRLPTGYLELLPRAELVRRALSVHPEPTLPCHNDLLAGNFIDAGDKLWLIDYEYSGNNEPTFELGNIWSEARLTLDQLDELMTVYDGAHLPHRVARARLWGLMSKYGWTLWASIQDATSEFDFDFWSWGMEKYDRAVAEFRSPEFEGLLADVAGRVEG